MFTINSKELPLINNLTDYTLGGGLFAWSNDLTKVQFIVSNYSLSLQTLKDINFYDTNSDSMSDDTHITCKVMWKTNGKIKIIPTYVMANLISV